jgi:glycosyltransferase involved in cell wall biosynthesis
VYFIPSDDGGCGWLRCLLPALGLAEVSGWHARGAWGLRYDMRELKSAEVVVFQRQGSGPALLNMRACQDRGQTVVYEIDDYALMTPRSTEPAARQLAHSAGREYILACMRQADLVTVTTQPLADVYARFNPRIAVLPNCTHPEINVPEARGPSPSGRLTVAYAAALAHNRDAALLRGVIPAVAGNHPEADFLFFGDWPKTDWSLDLPRTYRMDFLPLRAYYHALTLFDIGLAPLVDSQFTRCKSAVKALDYLGAGVAPVLKNHPIYTEFKHGADCLKATTPADWIHNIGMLLHSSGLRAQLVSRGQRLVAAYDYRNHAHSWATAYNAALEARRRPDAR